MTMNNFPTYPHDQLEQIKLNGISPESINYGFDCKHIKQKHFKSFLVNGKEVFFASTQFKKPVFKFRVGQEIDFVSPYDFNNRAICCGQLEYIHKGFRMTGYLFQFID